MKEEIEQIEINKTWTLVTRLKDKNLIGTKWLYRNKLDENGEVTRNKERLVCKGDAQEEGIDYGEIVAPIERLEEVRILLAYFAYKGFKFYQMDVKSACLNGILEEDVYIEQPKGFFDANNKTWYVDYTNIFMVWSKHQEHGMRDFISILWRLDLKELMITTIRT